MGYSYELVNGQQADTFLKMKLVEKWKEDSHELSTKEIDYIVDTELRRRPDILKTIFPKYSVNTTSKGQKAGDNAGIANPTPATDTVVGSDPYRDTFVTMTPVYCNYHTDDNGVKRLDVLEDEPGFTWSGGKDVGVIIPTPYLDRKETPYQVETIWAELPNHAMLLHPAAGAIGVDGWVCPYLILSAFPSSTGSDGLLHSYYDGIIARLLSQQQLNTEYGKKGKNCTGAGSERREIAEFLLEVKYATKNSQSVFAGLTNYYFQEKVAYAESGVRRVLVASSTSFVADTYVSLGTANGDSIDRKEASMHRLTVSGEAIQTDTLRIDSVEEVVIEGTTYKALNLDLDVDIDTTTNVYVSTMPSRSGTTRNVIDHYDGSPVSNTSGAFAYRIGLLEFGWGSYCIEMNWGMNVDGDRGKLVYVRDKGVTYSPTYAGYRYVGKIPAYNASNSDWWIGDITLDKATGVLYPHYFGVSDSTGHGDRVWAGGSTLAIGAKRAPWIGGHLGHTSSAGLSSLYCSAPSHAHWYGASCD